MLDDTLKEILACEKEAKNLLDEMNEKCAAIIENAKLEAENIRSSALNDARSEQVKLMDQAIQEGEDAGRHALDSVSTEISGLQQEAETKKKEAMTAVIDALFM